VADRIAADHIVADHIAANDIATDGALDRDTEAPDSIHQDAGHTQLLPEIAGPGPEKTARIHPAGAAAPDAAPDPDAPDAPGRTQVLPARGGEATLGSGDADTGAASTPEPSRTQLLDGLEPTGRAEGAKDTQGMPLLRKDDPTAHTQVIPGLVEDASGRTQVISATPREPRRPQQKGTADIEALARKLTDDLSRARDEAREPPPAASPEATQCLPPPRGGLRPPQSPSPEDKGLLDELEEIIGHKL
jgi:hypothetical protein